MISQLDECHHVGDWIDCVKCLRDEIGDMTLEIAHLRNDLSVAEKERSAARHALYEANDEIDRLGDKCDVYAEFICSCGLWMDYSEWRENNE